MSYNSEHKQKNQIKIVDTARILFNRHGFQDVTIDMVMENAGLTRDGFYNHLKSKGLPKTAKLVAKDIT